MRLTDLQRAAFDGAEAKGFHDSLRPGQPMTERYRVLILLGQMHAVLDKAAQAVKRHGITASTTLVLNEAFLDIHKQMLWMLGQDEHCTALTPLVDIDDDVDNRAATLVRLALVSTEVSEATEVALKCNHVGLSGELADILIRVADLAEAVGIDLDVAVQAKLAYNQMRPYGYGTPGATATQKEGAP